MFRLKLQPPRNRFRISRETPVKPERTLVSTVSDQSVDQEQVGLACRNEPSTVGGDVDTDDGVSKSWESGLEQRMCEKVLAVDPDILGSCQRTFAFFPIESNNLISPLLLATANFPDSVVAAAEKSFFDAYCLNSDWTSLFPSTRGSIRKRPL